MRIAAAPPAGFRAFRLALFALAAWSAAPPARADVIADWGATAEGVLAAEGAETPARYALLHVAMYDAVNAIDGRFAVFAVRPATAARDASKEAAAATAAYRVLLDMFPHRAEQLDTAYDASLERVPSGPAKTKGVAIGAEVAAKWLARKADAAPGGAAPYLLGDGAAGFAELASERYASDFATTDARAPSAATVAAAGFYSERPTSFFARNLRAIAAAHGFDVETNARLFALVHVTQAASVSACGNAEYECLGPAFAESLRQFFGTSYVQVTLTSTVARSFDNTREIVDEIRAACLFGGERDRTSVETGEIIGRKVARRVATDFELVAHGGARD